MENRKTLEVLISTMHQTDYTLLDKMNVKSDAVVVNQCNKNSIEKFVYNGHKITWINDTSRGLSKSRNIAISHSTADYCLICDDDELLDDSYMNTILDTFLQLPQADIIAFDYIKEGDSRYKKRINIGMSKKISKASYFKTFNSIRLSFNRRAIVDNDIIFDERFGAGSGRISCGEETVWQRQAQKKHLIRYYCPKIIAVLKQGESSWFRGLNEKYYYDIGACLVTNYGFLSNFLIFYYLLFISGSHLHKKEQFFWMKKGVRMFKKMQFSYEEYLEYENRK